MSVAEALFKKHYVDKRTLEYREKLAQKKRDDANCKQLLKATYKTLTVAFERGNKEGRIRDPEDQLSYGDAVFECAREELAKDHVTLTRECPGRPGWSCSYNVKYEQ